MTSIQQTVIDQQRDWAEQNGLRVDPRGYLPSVEDNLFQPLSPTAMAGLGAGSGSELRDRDGQPAKARALHSSAILVVNVFDYWSGRDRKPLQEALGLAEPIHEVEFERQFRTGLRGTPPNVDVVLRLGGNGAVAIESKFCEWMTPRSQEKPLFASAYFPGDESVWKRAGLDDSDVLAKALATKREHFEHLDVAQLLKHALGLHRCFGSAFQLWYLYYAGVGKVGDTHREEVRVFAQRVGGELRFRALSYQDLLAHLASAAGPPHAAYVEYLSARYIPAAPEAPTQRAAIVESSEPTLP